MVIGVILGAFIWLLLELNKGFVLPDFTWRTFFKKNIVPFTTNMVLGLTIVWFQEDIKEFIPLTKVYSVVIGMSGQAFFKKIVGIFDSKIGTKLGINEKPQ